MAFTVVATWDFRGADNEATKLAPRIGGFSSLTKQGTPTIDTNGVACAADGQGLTLTLPAGLKYVETFWLMCALRRTGTTTAACNIFGFINNSTDLAPYHSLNHLGWSGDTGRIDTNASGSQISSTTDTTYLPTSSTNEVWTIRRDDTSAKLYKASTEMVSATVTSGNWPTYGATAHLAVGCQLGVSRNVNTRFDWLIIGTGAITTGEMTTIQTTPNNYLYPASSIAAISSGYHVRNINR